MRRLLLSACTLAILTAKPVMTHAAVPILGHLAASQTLNADNSTCLLQVTRRIVQPVAQETHKPRIFQINFSINESNFSAKDKSGRLKRLSAPSALVVEGRAAEFDSENHGNSAGIIFRPKPCDFYLCVTPSDSDGKTVLINAKLESWTLVSQTSATLKQVTGRTLNADGRVKLGEPVRLILDKADGKKVWCDLTVTEYTPE